LPSKQVVPGDQVEHGVADRGWERQSRMRRVAVRPTVGRMEIRRAQPSDCPGIEAVVAAAFDEEADGRVVRLVRALDRSDATRMPSSAMPGVIPNAATATAVSTNQTPSTVHEKLDDASASGPARKSTAIR